ncbi:DNA repair protein RecN [Humidisolicoccus flavus]|uniref:DNA repair protein RecN n=1 Tax=Humidisolicoccus flavus TaxID=3111414 RepID=UPI00324556A9
MIDELSLHNLGVIEAASLRPSAGFTALTGETGAGKTMVLSALSLLRGQRADSGLVRAGTQGAHAEAFWVTNDPAVVEQVEASGGFIEDEQLIVSRSVNAEGRSRASLGGRSVPAGVLQSLSEHLVTVHGQSDQLRLRSEAAQRDALDAAGGAALADVMTKYRQHLKNLRAAESELTTIIEERDARIAEAEQLRGDLEAVELVDPKPGEDEQLQSLAGRLENAEHLRALVAEASIALTNDGGTDAQTLVGGARQLIERGISEDPALQPAHSLLLDAEALVAEAAGALATYRDGLAEEHGDLNEINERRSDLAALARRFGGTIEDALEAAKNGAVRLVELEGDGERTEHLEAQIEQERALVAELASELSRQRASVAERLSEAVSAELRGLAMPDASFTIQVTPGETFSAHGADEVQFLLAPHRGATPRPVTKSASGGELSRVMLALEVALASDRVPTLVFDEIDAGVGGEAAIEIGRRLKQLSSNAQVIVITHLAQVAAFADRQIVVQKSSNGNVTASSVQTVDGVDRERELARMLSGRADSDTALAHARELLAQS